MGPYQCLHHVGSLQSEALHCLEDIQDAFCLHPLQNCTQCAESPRSASTSTVNTHTHTDTAATVNFSTLAAISCCTNNTDISGRSQGRGEQFLRDVFSCDLKSNKLKTHIVSSISMRANDCLNVSWHFPALAHGSWKGNAHVTACVCCILPAVHCDGVVARLLLLFLHCSDYVDHAFTVSGDAHLWPAVEMELTHCSGLVLLDRQVMKKDTSHLKTTVSASIVCIVCYNFLPCCWWPEGHALCSSHSPPPF